ncbi:hypothetical protein BGW36DRAFT_302917 [Talaromyces proteolyticus]|uniref:Extracellular thaumatin domain protein n=1 Tax=Talaromyces proteolyticus TaxID=1131652 RepID=A0AAD4KN97_9EURO|nr:uncharacterized protein BGW36DRAFT_302917 [Talaromyces proteolyticus]KAH8693025.1 hypothetical protein BGW36DRAFT_302917 [Talaromyces proteolyticus]
MFAKALGLVAVLGAAASAMPASHYSRHGHSHNFMHRRDNITSDGVEITNNMEQTIYLWSVGDSSSEMQTLNTGDTYSEIWQTRAVGGYSIKMSFSEQQTDVLQFEYTLEDPTIWWDLSCIDMGSNSQFTTVGFAVSSNDVTCPSATCAPGDSACADAYLVPSDNQATHACASADLMTLNLGPASNSTSTA